MRQKQDHDLDVWLANYRIARIGEPSHRMLLDKIVAAARVLPQLRPQVFNRQTLMSHLEAFISYRQAWGLIPNAAALAAVALVGFWVGIGSTKTPISIQTAVQQATSTNADYFDQIVFGPKSWREVNL
jgi:hypothetical protein